MCARLTHVNAQDSGWFPVFPVCFLLEFIVMLYVTPRHDFWPI
jgi:hypothetical protein